MKCVKIILGRICSGKDWISNRYNQYDKLVVSDIVKQIIKSNNRVDLQKTQHLDTEITNQIINKLSNKTIINGIRQLSILKNIVSYLDKNGFKYEIIWIQCSIDIRKKRFYNRKDIKDTDSFEQCDIKDNELGLKEIEQYCYSNNVTIIYN